MKKLLSKLICGRIVGIHRICNMISFEFRSSDDEKIFIHVQSFLRFVKNNKVIISSEDMYRCGKNASEDQFNWDEPGKSRFDDAVEDNLTMISESRITEIKKNNVGDVNIQFENNLELNIIIDTVVSEEKYRVFDDDKHIVFES